MNTKLSIKAINNLSVFNELNKIFDFVEVKKSEICHFFSHYHEAKSSQFITKFCFAMKHKGQVIGALSFAPVHGKQTLKSWTGEEKNTGEILELNRMVFVDGFNNNSLKWDFLRISMDKLRRKGVKGVLTYSTAKDKNKDLKDVYFNFYGTTSPKKDFYKIGAEKTQRTKTKDVCGIWVNREPKNIFFVKLDNNFKILKSPKHRSFMLTITNNSFCNCSATTKDGLLFRRGQLFSNHNFFSGFYTCPHCFGKVEKI